MLLLIHNLPQETRYADIKVLIRERCGLTDIILDNLEPENQQSRKVTVGLTDESDASLMQKELNGFIFMGRKLFVEDMRHRKQVASNPINIGNNMAANKQSRNLEEATKNIPSLLSIPFQRVQYKVTDKQDTLYQFQSVIAQNSNAIITRTQSVTSFNPTPSMYEPNKPAVEKNNMVYNSQSSFGGNKREMVNSNDFQADFIPFSTEKSLKDSYNRDQCESRYFQIIYDDRYPTSDCRQGSDRLSGRSNERSVRRSPVRKEREPYEPRSRSNISREMQFDNRNRTDDFSRRSDGSNNVMAKNKIRGESNNRYIKPATVVYSRSVERNFSRGRGENRYTEDNSRRSDSGYSKILYDGNPKPFTDSFRRNYDKSTNNAFGSNYNRSNDRSRKYADNNSNIGRTNQKEKNAAYRPNPKVPKYDKQYTRISDRDLKSRFAVNQKQKFEHNPKSRPPSPKTEKLMDTNAAKRRNDIWIAQAATNIARDLIKVCSRTDLWEDIKFMYFLKKKIKARITALVGKRIFETFLQITTEYQNIYQATTQKPFLNEVIKEFKELRLEQKHEETEDFEVTGSSTVVETKGVKRKGTGTIKTNEAKKPHVHSAATQQNIEYPHDGSLPILDIKEEPVYELSPDLQKVLEKEMEVLCDLYKEECKYWENESEETVLNRVMENVQFFKKVVTQDVTKRVLNISQIILRIYIEPKILTDEMVDYLKELGIVSLSKSFGNTLYLGTCKSFECYDKLCALDVLNHGGYTLSFKPLTIKGLQRRKRVRNKWVDEETENEDEETSKDVNEIDRTVIISDVESIDGDDKDVIFIDGNVTNVEITKDKEKTESNNKKNNPVVSIDNVLQTETEVLLKDIQTLTDSIRNGSNGHNYEKTIDPDLVDIANISEDDLEDF